MKQTNVWSDLARLMLLTVVVLACLALSKDWFGAQGLYTSANHWFGERMADTITDSIEKANRNNPTSAPPAP